MVGEPVEPSPPKKTFTALSGTNHQPLA